MKTIRPLIAGAVLAASLLWHAPAGAGVIVGGSSLLAAGDVTQLESWLGQGPLTLTNVFTKGIDGTTSAQWHAAVDGLGATFSILRMVDNLGVETIVGGYNPQSWSTSGGLNITTPDSERTAFVFNLTTGVIARQCKSTDSILCGVDSDVSNSVGARQTYNNISYGPTFGGGFDLYVNSNLSTGYSYAYSYGLPAGDSFGAANSPLDSDPSTHSWQSITALETFMIAAGSAIAPIPTPGTLALFGLGLSGLGWLRRRRAA